MNPERATPDRWACLMYHEVCREQSLANYFAVPRDRFAAQVDALRCLGLSACSLEEALEGVLSAPVALTFDDGHESHYQQAFPLLLDRRVRATFFVTSERVGTPGHVTWGQLREMSDAGMSIQSHTATHPFLSELDRAGAEWELSSSKEEIEQRLGRACTTIALPGGDRPKGWRASDYQALGYRSVAMSQWGPNRRPRSRDNDLRMPFVRRYTVRRETLESRLLRLATATEPAYGPEGLRYAGLHVVRTILGATRYARLRRALLTRLGR